MESIAVIGIGCRFPGAPNLRAFWQLMCSRGDAIREVPADRYNIDAFYDPRPATPGKVMSRYGGFLEQVDQFDAAFFGISPREAAKMDPQHRLLLEVAWEAMEDAGQTPRAMTVEEKLDIGCFIGVITGDYWDRQFRNSADLDVYATAGSARSGAAGRISFSQNLMGTSFAIDAACSSSLVAIDQAVQNLRAGACTMAVAGGVNIILNPDHTIGFSQGKMMAADGHCKTYDTAADGYVRSEGAGVVVLKLLSQALADGDRVYAVIRGSAANNDGHCASFMAPSTRGQQAGLRKACRNAEIDPLSIDYVEAHGPGTKAGDPIEITTLGEVLCAGRPSAQPLLVGSVKTNIGHTEGAAGVAGLIKAILCLNYGMIPPNLHFHTPNPEIPWQNYALKIPTELLPWPRYNAGPRRAVVCSYGIAGTNTYVVLEEAPYQGAVAAARAYEAYLLPLSAQTSGALRELAHRYLAHLEDEFYTNQALYDLSATASLRRIHHDYRLAIVSHSRQEVHDKLAAFLRGEVRPDVSSGRKVVHRQQKVAWIFPGQGSQWLGMGRDLLEQEPVFRAAIEECDRAIRACVNWSLLDRLQADEEDARQGEIDVIQPMLFAIEVALAALWRSWGIEPAVVVGHSMGEVAAAYVAGALSLEDAAWIICARSKLLLRVSGQGAMAAVELSLEHARALVADYKERVSVAVSNSPHSTVLSGDLDALTEILALLEQQGIFGRFVKVDIASHSPQMDPLRADLLCLLEHVQPCPATIPMFSTVRGNVIEGRELDACYWADNLREPVLFLSTIQALLADGCEVFLEMSPHPILVGAIRQTCTQDGRSALALASLRRQEEGRATLLATLGALYVQGCEPDWSGVYLDKGRHVSLPAYPWQRQRCWNSALDHSPVRSKSSFPATHNSAGGHPILGTSILSALHPQTFFWTTTLNADIFPYLAEHRVHDVPVLACAAYLELALAAAREFCGPRGFVIEGLMLKKALFFPKGASQTLQVILTPQDEKIMSLRFFSIPDGEEKQAAWIEHASATVRFVKTTVSTTTTPVTNVPVTPSVLTTTTAVAVKIVTTAMPTTIAPVAVMSAPVAPCTSSQAELASVPARGYMRGKLAEAVHRGGVLEQEGGPQADSGLFVRQGGEGLCLPTPPHFPAFACLDAQSTWTLAVEAPAYYAGLRMRGIQHGPLFQGITHVWRRPGEVMAHITIPEELVEDMPGYQVHPALLDACLQGITPFLPEDRKEATYVPVAVRRVKFYQRPDPGETLWTHTVAYPLVSGENDVLEGDVFLLNEQGQVLLEVLGFRLQGLDSDSTQDFMRHRLNRLLYALHWKPQSLRERREQRVLRRNWLIFSERAGLGERLAEHLRAVGAHCVLVTPGDIYQQVEPQWYMLPPADPQAFQRLFSELYGENGEQRAIVYLWGMLTTPVRAGILDLDQDCAEIGALHLLQAIVAKKVGPLRLWLVTSGVHSIEKQDEAAALLQAPLWGLGRTIVYEHQDLHATLIDVDAISPEEQAESLFRELWSDDAEDEVALRGERRYVARLVRRTLPGEHGQRHFRSDGTYLISGGLGGVGLRVAQWMIEQGARHLVLLGRRGPSEVAVTAVNTMRAAGANVYPMQVDVAQERQLADALDKVRDTLPSLRGVFHAAVVLDDGTLLQLNRERFQGVRPPRLDGAWNLHRLTLADPLDYFVLFSSAASLIGSPGQGNYAAASAFLDQLAFYRQQQGYPALCVNWGRWGEVGQATREKRGERLDARGFAGMKPEEGLSILGDLLHQSSPQVGAMSFHLPGWSQFYPDLTRSSLFTSLLAEAEEPLEQQVGIQPLTREGFCELGGEQRKQVLAQYLSDQIARVLGHARLKLEPEQQLNRLGLDSLMSVELKNRIGSDLNVSVSITTFMQSITFEQFIIQVIEQIELTRNP